MGEASWLIGEAIKEFNQGTHADETRRFAYEKQ
jgi:hypothetical protein